VNCFELKKGVFFLDSICEDVAESLSANKELMPYLPEFLCDLWELGGVPEIITDLIKTLDRYKMAGAKCLDLGCGKGAVSMKIAQELDFFVDGIDGFTPFINDAKERAKKMA
jgi:2-polyprenyl-3-methyl-5-hydroxy-6-metoxy-1,4-benzoquinol methylase